MVVAGSKNKRALHLAREEAQRNAFAAEPLGIDPGAALQLTLDRAVSMLTFAGAKADALNEDEITVHTAFGPVDHQWIRLERELRQEVAGIAARMVQIGIAEHHLRLKEAQATLLLQAILAAARDAGIPRDKVKRLGPALRTHLEVVQGGKAA